MAMTTSGFVAIRQQRHFGVTELPGEPTEHPALRIAPEVERVRERGEFRLQFTGRWALIHEPTGYEVDTDGPLPLPVLWLRRFGRLLAESGIDWDRLTGDTRLVGHPEHARVREVGRTFLDCWRHGVPVDPLAPSLQADEQGWYLRCANTGCEDNPEDPWVLLGGEDGQDDVRVADDQTDELCEFARVVGWRRLDDEHAEYWLCVACAARHQPAPAEVLPFLPPRPGQLR